MAFTQILVSNKNLGIGPVDSPSIAIDDLLEEVVFTVDRTAWPDIDTKFAIDLLQSTNGGPFQSLGGCLAEGSVTNKRAPQTSVSAQLRPGRNRALQVSYRVSGKPFRSTLTVEGR